MKPKKKKRSLKFAKSPRFLFIGLSSYIRPHSETMCVHLPKLNFTDALFEKDCQTFQLALSRLNIARSWEEILESYHHHKLNLDDCKRLGKHYLRLTDNETKNLVLNDIYQIALDEEDKFRVYGIKKEFDNKDYFEILLFDPNHLFHPELGESKYPYEKKAVCLMDCLGGDKGGKCLGVNEEPKDKRLI